MRTGGERRPGSQGGSTRLSNSLVSHTGKHLYLFTLEVEPLKVGAIYDELPLHCTLMHRFYSRLSAEELSDSIKPLFDKSPPITLTVYEHTKLGPKQVPVCLISLTKELDNLNMQLFNQLNQLEVEYTAPQWVGKGHVFHVTDRKNEKLDVGGNRICKAAYLIEVVDHKRIVRKRFELS